MEIIGTSDNGDGVSGTSTNGGAGVRGTANGANHDGVVGESNTSGDGIAGFATNGDGVSGTSANGGAGVRGTANGANHDGVVGQSNTSGDGIAGFATNGDGISGTSTNGGAGVRGTANGANHDGVVGQSNTSGDGIAGFATNGDGVSGTSTNGGAGVRGTANGANHEGVVGQSNTSGDGIAGFAANGDGVSGTSTNGGAGVRGTSASAGHIGVVGQNIAGGFAGGFFGDVQINGNLQMTGDILLSGADCAERFDLRPLEQADPGSVMIVDETGGVRICDIAYDQKVVGVVSGAGTFRPGIVLDQTAQDAGRTTIALVGKVWCKVDAKSRRHLRRRPAYHFPNSWTCYESGGSGPSVRRRPWQGAASKGLRHRIGARSRDTAIKLSLFCSHITTGQSPSRRHDVFDKNQNCGSCGSVSSLLEQDGGTNASCHGFTGGVAPGGEILLPQARVILILWDHYFVTHAEAVADAKQLMMDLVSGRFVNGLTQYGIHRGTLVNTIVIDTNTTPAPTTWDVNDGNDAKQIVAWINDGIVSPQPSVPRGQFIPSELYFIFMPSTTQLTAGKNSDGTPNTNVCGWHNSGNLANDASTPVFWALVRTDQAPRTSELAFVSSVAFCVGHELAEALTDGHPGLGFTASNGCEIGDICELNQFTYRGWSIEQYWSNWDATCVNGDNPVSLRKFLRSISYNASSGLRGLPLLHDYAGKIGLDYIADRSFPIFQAGGG